MKISLKDILHIATILLWTTTAISFFSMKHYDTGVLILLGLTILTLIKSNK